MATLPDPQTSFDVPSFRPELAFPYLTEDMVRSMGSYGTVDEYRNGIEVSTAGQREAYMYVVLEGGINVYTRSGRAEPESLIQLQRIHSIFLMIGAEPKTQWLNGLVNLDEKGFVKTGGPAAFEPTPYATNVPGIYAVGDVRSGSVKRVASAVGEGSVVMSDVHRYLAQAVDTVEASACGQPVRSATATQI
jgi:thioredoxin reductase